MTEVVRYDKLSLDYPLKDVGKYYVQDIYQDNDTILEKLVDLLINEKVIEFTKFNFWQKTKYKTTKVVELKIKIKECR